MLIAHVTRREKHSVESHIVCWDGIYERAYYLRLRPKGISHKANTLLVKDVLG